MTQEELLKRLEAILIDREEWQSEVRKGFAVLSERLTSLESEIRSTGGIVGKALCEEREEKILLRVKHIEGRQDSAAIWTRTSVIGATLAVLGAVLGWIFRK